MALTDRDHHDPDCGLSGQFLNTDEKIFGSNAPDFSRGDEKTVAWMTETDKGPAATRAKGQGPGAKLGLGHLPRAANHDIAYLHGGRG